MKAGSMASRAIALAFLAVCALARPRNITLDDDMPGNNVASISYDPAGAWFEGQLCESACIPAQLCSDGLISPASLGCRAMPDRNTVYNGTWHHTTDDDTIDTQDTTMTIQFTGAYWHTE